MLKFLDRFELWPTLKKSARATRMRRYVAVGYLGPEGAALLPLRRDDVLICPLTEQHAKNGSVCPTALKTYLKRGVKVYLQDDLHAKVFLFGRTSIVGSSNLSRSSQNDLDEAALLTKDAAVARRLKQWFGARMHSPLTPEWLSHCQKIYRPRRDEIPVHGKRRTSIRRTGLWLMPISGGDFPEDEKKQYEQGERKALSQLDDRRHYSVETVRYVGKARFLDSVRKGDLLVEIYEERNGRRKVCPHARLVNLKRIRKGADRLVTYLYLEMPKKYRTLRWKRFKTECHKMGLRLQRVSIRKISDIVLANKVLSFVSPETLGIF